jgi:hypothetical protein
MATPNGQQVREQLFLSQSPSSPVKVVSLIKITSYDFSHSTISARKKVFAAITIPLLLHACR